MWKLVYGSVQGTSHVISGKPCQDYCAGNVVSTTVVAACSDGAGPAHLTFRKSLEGLQHIALI